MRRNSRYSPGLGNAARRAFASERPTSVAVVTIFRSRASASSQAELIRNVIASARSFVKAAPVGERPAAIELCRASAAVRHAHPVVQGRERDRRLVDRRGVQDGVECRRRRGDPAPTPEPG